MQSFLEQSVQFLEEKYQLNLNLFCVVLPTRRACTVFENLLKAKEIKELPYIIAIEDFIPEMTGTRYTGQVTLLLELYDTFRQIDKQTNLDKFTAWGYILLKDFEQIDKNLIDAQKLFENLCDIQNIKKWGLTEERMSEKMKKYFQLWDNLYTTYQAFKTKLEANQQAYPGMLYRQLAENADALLVENPRFKHYVFLGFNALSKSEELIFKTLLKKKKADILWDSDLYYMNEHTENRAGIFLEQYKKTWAEEGWNFQENHLLTTEKNIEIISTGNTSLQGRIANQLLKNWQYAPDKKGKTVIVLADENILLSVLNALDDDFKGLNITMGVSLRNSALFHLIDLYFDIHQNTKKIKENDVWTQKFNYKSIIKIFGHAFVKSYEQKKYPENPPEGIEEVSFIQALISFINKNNQFFLSKEEILGLPENPVFTENLPDEFIRYYQNARDQMKGMIELLLENRAYTPELIECLDEIMLVLEPKEDEIETQYFKQFREMMEELKSTFAKIKTENQTLYRQISKRAFKTFLYQAFRTETIAFDSDRENALQMMGILETRVLDFENVIILSMNEKVIPKNKKITSFIPLDILRGFDLPTYTEQDAIVSYHFYRLLQRAKNIALVHVNPSDTYGGYEKSRFIYQLENDLARLNPKIKLNTQMARFEQNDTLQVDDLKIYKNTQIKQKIKSLLAKGLSPVHLNSFVTCSLKYYFSQIAELKEFLMIDEDLGSDKFGTIVHEILEEMYRKLSDNEKGEVKAEDLIQEKEFVEEIVIEKFKKREYANYALTGANYITKEVAVEFVKRFIDAQVEEIKENGMPFQIIVLENIEGQLDEAEEKKHKPKISAYFKTEVEGEELNITISGIIDRIDKIGNKTRIIDYKTGQVDKKQVSLKQDELDKLMTDPDAGKVRQLWIYKYILAKRIITEGEFQLGKHFIKPDDHIVAGIYTLRDMGKGLLEFQEEKDKNVTPSQFFSEDLKDFVEISEQYLTSIIQTMLDETIHFEKTDDMEVCAYCSYKDICGR